MPRPYTFTRYADHQVAPKEAVNDLQAAIEALDSGGTSFTAYGGTTALPGETVVPAATGVAATDTANIAAAIATAGAGGVLRFRPGTYLVNALAANQADQIWLLPPNCILKAATGIGVVSVVTATADRVQVVGGQVDYSLGTGEGFALTAQGSRTADVTSVTVAATKGAKTVTVASAASINAGDVLIIRSKFRSANTDGATNVANNTLTAASAAWTSADIGFAIFIKGSDGIFTTRTVTAVASGTSLTYSGTPLATLSNRTWVLGGEIFSTDTPQLDLKSEFVTVASKAGNVLTIVGALRDSYDPALGVVTIDKLALLDSPQFNGIRVTGAGVSATQTAVYFKHTKTPNSEDCQSIDCARGGLSYENCMGGGSKRFTTYNAAPAASSYGYGIVCAGCEGVVNTGAHTYNSRTGYDVTGHSVSGQPVSRNNSYIGCFAFDIDSSAFDTHGAADMTTYIGCHAVRCGQFFGARGRNTHYLDCHGQGIHATSEGGLFKAGLLFGYGNGGKGFRFIGGSIDATPISGVTGTKAIWMDGDIFDDVLILGVKIWGANQDAVGIEAGNPYQTIRKVKLQSCDIDASTGVGSGANPIKIFQTQNDGNNIIDLDLLDNNLIANGSAAAVAIAGNGASGANVSKRIRVARNRAVNATTFLVMTTGFFDGTEIVIEDNDCPDVTSYANLVTVTVGNFTAMPVVRNNLISQVSTANGRGVVGISATAPTTGTYLAGDIVLLPSPVEAGTTPNKYVVTGYICVLGGTAGTWLQMRTLTGN